ncbi:TVP38/TMEM64 family protein [Natrialbaceae archaeon A-gly3]
MTVPAARPIAGLLVLSGVLVVGVATSPSAAFGTFEAVAADPYLFGLAVAGMYLVRPLFAWPTTPLAVVVGYGYGVTLGVPVALAGVVATVIPTFLAVRWFADGSSGGPTVFGSVLERACEATTRYYETTGPVRGVVVSRLAPIPSDVSTAAAAVSDVDLRQLAVGTAIGEIPWTVAAVVVGASAATITTAGVGDLGTPLAAACTVAGALLLAGPAYRLLSERPAASS